MGQHYLCVAFLVTTSFSLPPQILANYTYFWDTDGTDWNHTIPNQTNGNNDGRNESLDPVTREADYEGRSTSTLATPTSSAFLSLAPDSREGLSTPPPTPNSSLTTWGTGTTRKIQNESTKASNCEENNKMAMLVCLIIIAVLFLICTLLFLSTVVLANKVSALKRSKQMGKRLPRSNGDFLANSGLWPAESDTWKRAKQLTGPNLMMQSTGTLTALGEGEDEEASRKLAN
ncbi:protein EVI2A [Ornithorhynchus anatinus]|uniref:Ecotropic viral integration site 2A n=1 Tax=Ornithorhynchus anatinus TaxID=9258 RepID=F6PVI7_ORNAN|nr:protein EVI2A [Ornithorhynchus anatinus]XP_007664847.1 protein EVI2A [Ornithorhynchus anatinus]